jgi:glycosyltransferase involved in cell wall biosynthesis
MSIHIFFPVYNEVGLEKYLSSLAFALSNEFPQDLFFLTVVDDGSENPVDISIDKCINRVKIEILRHAKNAGLGCALNTGLNHMALKVSPKDLVLTIEGDGTVPSDSIISAIERLKIRNLSPDVIIFSVYQHSGGFIGVPRSRLMLSRIANIMVRNILGFHGIWTATSFNRAFKGAALLRLKEMSGERMITKLGFDCNIELLASFMKLKLQIEEMPVIIDQSTRANSKMKIMRTIRNYLYTFLGALKIRKSIKSGYRPTLPAINPSER